MEFLGKIIQLILALPKLKSFLEFIQSSWMSLMNSIARKKQEKIAEEKKNQIDQGVDTGSSLPLEEAIGHSSPGRPSQDREGVKSRPISERV